MKKLKTVSIWEMVVTVQFVFIYLSESIKMKFYKAIILLIMCGCLTWYLTLKEEHTKLRLSENIVLRKLLGPKRLEEVRGRYQTT